MFLKKKKEITYCIRLIVSSQKKRKKKKKGGCMCLNVDARKKKKIKRTKWGL